jgi:hypothetical protein
MSGFGSERHNNIYTLIQNKLVIGRVPKNIDYFDENSQAHSDINSGLAVVGSVNSDVVVFG